MDCSLPGSSVHGVFQARVLEWVSISFSRGSSQPQGSNPGLPHCRQTLYCLSHQGSPYQKRWHMEPSQCRLFLIHTYVTVKNVFHCYSLRFARVLSRFSHVRLFVIPWTVAHQVPLSMEFSRPEYWSE